MSVTIRSATRRWAARPSATPPVCPPCAVPFMLLTGKWTTKGVHTVEEFDPTRIWRPWTSTACPAARATARLWWTDALERSPPALCGAGKPDGTAAASLPTPCYLLDEAQLRRNGEIMLELQQRTGCRVLLAQKAFSNFDVYPVLAPTWRAPRPAACTRAAWAGRSCRKRRTMCSALPTGQRNLPPFCSTPTTSCSTPPAS